MSTCEAYITLGAISIAISAIGAALQIESKDAAVKAPMAILTVLLPTRQGQGIETALDSAEFDDDESEIGSRR